MDAASDAQRPRIALGIVEAQERGAESGCGDLRPIDAVTIALVVEFDRIGEQRRHGIGGRAFLARAAPMDRIALHPASIAGAKLKIG